jgi:hypothetical protein
MQFVINGPNVPEALLQAHEDGRVVFFCGAGISYPAELPGFSGLVKNIFHSLGERFNSIEQNAFDERRYDAALNLFEQRVAGQRETIRAKLLDLLNPNLKTDGAIRTHEALLELSKNKSGSLRIVTTNFDRIFEFIAKQQDKHFKRYIAPMLPIAKDSKWDGLVYLHGLLPEAKDLSALNRLVLTSGDFGLAYLTERWAARFVTDLLRNYVVCFVGYSIDDPVLRYIMDALAADRMLGESSPPAYAFGEYSAGDEQTKFVEWSSKGVSPILYLNGKEDTSHSALHQTLAAWAEMHRSGTLSKERIVLQYALGEPTSSTLQDDFVGRMLWAISDPSGLPAKRFADLEPLPSLRWLDVFAENRFTNSDLIRFGIKSDSVSDLAHKFNVLSRPAPSLLAPRMSILAPSKFSLQWDPVMAHLARWISRHWTNPELFQWLTQSGTPKLHPRLIEHIRYNINHKQDAESSMPAKRSDHSTQGPENPTWVMEKIWGIVIADRSKSEQDEFEIYAWMETFKQTGLTASLRIMLRSLIAPKVKFEKAFRIDGSDTFSSPPSRISDVVSWEIELSASHFRSAYDDFRTNPQWQNSLPGLIEDFQITLYDALNLMSDLGEASAFSDRSQWDLPSITPHLQNRSFSEWTILIELLRDSWLALRKLEPGRAREVAQSWFEIPYLTFKRLALFAASQSENIPDSTWLEWLTRDSANILWSSGTHREVMRLIALKCVNLELHSKILLEQSILRGPPNQNREVADFDEFALESTESQIWIRLSKLKQANSALSTEAEEALARIGSNHPHWLLKAGDRDEFLRWTTISGQSEYDYQANIEPSGHDRKRLAEWIRINPTSKWPIRTDPWQESCRILPFRCLVILRGLAQQQIWPSERWNTALYVWSNKAVSKRFWELASPLIAEFPEKTHEEVEHAYASWLESAARSTASRESNFLMFCERFLRNPHGDGVDTTKPVTRSLNHPSGRVVQGIVNVCLRDKPSDNSLLRDDIKQIFTQICAHRAKKSQSGRVILSMYLEQLFRVDPTWAAKFGPKWPPEFG